MRYVEGDLFKSLDDQGDMHLVIIPHVVNIEKVWSAGFVIPLTQRFPKAKDVYLNDKDLKLGNTQFVVSDKGNTIVANMIAQTFTKQPPLQYDALEACLKSVGDAVAENGKLDQFTCVEIRCPMFGAGIAGGDWNKIEKLIKKYWAKATTTVFYLPQFLPSNWKPPKKK